MPSSLHLAASHVTQPLAPSSHYSLLPPPVCIPATLLCSAGFLAANFSQSYDLSPPSIEAFLPHTVHSPNSFNPAFKISRDRSHVSIVLGIPTVKRQYQSYLVTTLQSVLDNMTEQEMADTLIIIFIAETDPEYVYQIRYLALILNNRGRGFKANGKCASSKYPLPSLFGLMSFSPARTGSVWTCGLNYKKHLPSTRDRMAADV